MDNKMTFVSRHVLSSYWEGRTSVMSLCGQTGRTACGSVFGLTWSLRHGEWPIIGASGELFSSMRVRR